VVDPQGPICACGLRGCLEMFVSGPAIARRAREAIAAGRSSSLSTLDPDALDARDVYRAATEGDALACELVEDVGRRLAWAIHLLVMAYDVDRVVLGGGVSHAGDTFVQPIYTELERLRADSPLAREQLPPGVVELLPAGADAGAWGAVSIARQSVIE
jgi:glucokinase